MKKLIDVYPYRLKGEHPEFLILKRSAEKIYANQWRMVGGKVADEEKYWQAGLRELEEETKLVPVKFWAIPSVNNFYEAKTDTILYIPAFAAEIDENARIILDDEHTEYKWVYVEDIKSYIKWPEQRRLMQLTYDIITDKMLEILPEWNIEIPKSDSPKKP